MAITVLPLLKVGGMQLFKMEGPDTTEKILPRTIEVASIIIFTYFVLTLICGFLYWFFGMSIFFTSASMAKHLARNRAGKDKMELSWFFDFLMGFPSSRNHVDCLLFLLQ